MEAQDLFHREMRDVEVHYDASGNAMLAVPNRGKSQGAAVQGVEKQSRGYRLANVNHAGSGLNID